MDVHAALNEAATDPSLVHLEEKGLFMNMNPFLFLRLLFK